MRALTLSQPWATAIALGVKHVETRSWRTTYRGPLLIHAAQNFPKDARDFAREAVTAGHLPATLPFSAIVARCSLLEILPTEDVIDELARIHADGLERLYGDYTPGRWAWLLTHVEPLPEPIPARGALGLWTPDAGVIAAVEAALLPPLTAALAYDAYLTVALPWGGAPPAWATFLAGWDAAILAAEHATRAGPVLTKEAAQ